MIVAQLTPLFSKWAGEFLDAPIPAERKATCDNCAMCPPKEGPVAPDSEYYSPQTVCCTYQPDMANFLAGGVLADMSPAAESGRRTVEQRIATRLGITPLGLGRSPIYSVVYERSHEAFGTAKALECPHHLADGRCGVWQHRESTCATWFCKHERGQVGKDFWRRLHDLLAAAELALSRHCVLRAGLPHETLERLFPARGAGSSNTLRSEHLDGGMSDHEYAALWGPFVGREAELYRQSSEHVASLSWSEIQAIGGAELAVRLSLARNAHAALLSQAVPTRVRPRELRVLYGHADSARVATYSNVDPLNVPKKLLNVLHYFDGRRTDDALELIRRDHGLRIAPAVVRKLVDFGIVADASGPDASAQEE